MIRSESIVYPRFGNPAYRIKGLTALGKAYMVISRGRPKSIESLSMSRASLYRKIRAVSALPVNELIRNYRLKRATQYLRQGRTIAQMACSVGFDSPACFAKCFRELYHPTPTEFSEKCA